MLKWECLKANNIPPQHPPFHETPPPNPRYSHTVSKWSIVMTYSALLVTLLTLTSPQSDTQAEPQSAPNAQNETLATPDTAPRFMLSAMTSGGIGYQRLTNDFSGTTSASNLNLALGMAYEVGAHIQLGTIINAQGTFIDGYKTYTVTAIAGPVFNMPIDNDMRRAFFLGIGIGATYEWHKLELLEEFGDSTLSSTHFAWQLIAGKRFRMSDSVTYSPSLSIQGGGISEGTSAVLYSANVIAFDFFLIKQLYCAADLVRTKNSRCKREYKCEAL